MIEEIENIPNSWCVVRVDQVGELLRGINYSKLESSSNQQDHYFPILRSNNIQETLIFEDLVYVDKKNFNSFHFLRKGDILFAMSSGSKHLVGKTAKVLLDCNYGWGAFCAVLRPFEIVDKGFIAYFFKAPSYKKLVSEISKGTNINNLKREHILDLLFPLPPLAEQHRIVAKIEELFSELDKGVEMLKTAQQQLKVFRQAVLKYAFEGRLTNPDLKEGELPEGWIKKTFGSILKTIDGDRGSNYPKKHEFSNDGYCLFLSTKNVREGYFRFDEKIFITQEKDQILRGGKLKLGDVVITTRGTLGNVALYNEKIPFKNVRINSGMLILRMLDNQVLNNYLMKYVSSPSFSRQLNEKQSGTAQPQIPANVLKEITIQFPVNEIAQNQIVQEIESRLSVCDKIEESIEQGLQQAEALRQSILKKAFEGKLVPQDPIDEPASVLLERIRAERATSFTEKKKSTTKKLR